MINSTLKDTVTHATVSSRRSNSKIKAVFYSVVPSPYQRDFFYALSRLPEIDLTVYYLEAASPDSPWPEKALQPYEYILSGRYLAWGSSRFHVNWHLPKITQADVIVLNGYQNSVAQLILNAYAHRIPCIFWGEKMVANSTGIKGKLQHLFSLGLHHCQALVAIGSQAAQDYRQRFPDKPIFNIPYYCDLGEFSQYLPTRPRNPVTIFFCGQMIFRKGVDLLIKAFARLVDQGFNARLLLAGREADLPQMLQNVSQSVRDQIDYVGFQAPENLPQFFRRADIFVLPSRYDGWGVVVNQALGAGLPIICADTVGAAHDLIEPGVNGFTFPAGDIDKLFSALHSYLVSPEAIQQASQASLEKSFAWTPAVGAQRWLEVLQEITSEITPKITPKITPEITV